MGLNVLVNFIIWKNQKPPLKEATTIIAGDSHPMTSLNPKLLYNTINISQGAEPYVLTYWKLKEILMLNKIDTLILGFAPHNISEFNDKKFLNKFYSNEMFKRSYFIGEFIETNNLIEFDKKELINVFIRNTCLFPKLNHINYLGNYDSINESNLSNLHSDVKRHYYDKNIKLGVSKISVKYLNRIIQICNKNNIEILLISNPVHLNYYKKIPKMIIKEYDNLKKEFANKKIFVFDRTDFFYDDSLYANSDHLNYNGSIIFTKQFKKAKNDF